MNVEMRRFGAANEESGCRLELKVRGTRTRTWHRPAPQRHTVWPPKRAVVSIASGCCRGAPIASGSVLPASCNSDGGWRVHVIATHMGRQQAPATPRTHLLNRFQNGVATDLVQIIGSLIHTLPLGCRTCG